MLHGDNKGLCFFPNFIQLCSNNRCLMNIVLGFDIHGRLLPLAYQSVGV